MSFDRLSRFSRYESTGELDLQLTKVFGVSLGATILLQKRGPRLMNLFDNGIFKLLRHRFLPIVRAACK